MIINLNKIGKYNKISTKICIVGGGTVGLFLADYLRSKTNVDIVILEAGNENSTRAVKTHFKVNSKTHYNNKKEPSRMFGIGGTSVVWGGSMVSLSNLDFEKKNKDLKFWNIKFKEIYKYYLIVQKKLRFKILDTKVESKNIFIKKKIKYFSFGKKFFNLRFSTYLPNKIVNFYNFYFKKIKKDKELNIYTNARVFKINNFKSKSFEKNFTVKNILAYSDSGNILSVDTDLLIICCGAVESTRLVCIYDNDNNNFIKKQKSPLGNFFSEQLRISCGKFVIKNWKKFNLYFSPIYWKGTLHFPRLELKSKVQNNNNLSSIACQFIFEKSNKHWIYLFRKLLKKKYINFSSIISILISMPKILTDLCNYFFFRKLCRISWFYKPHKISLFINFGQKSNFNNKLFITQNIKNPKIKIKKINLTWGVRKEDVNTVQFFCKIFDESWRNAGLDKIATLKIIPQNYNFLFKRLQVYYHPTGSLRIGTSRLNSVVNNNLRLWDVENLYVCSTAVFPSSGSANTGMTLLALAARLGDHLVKKI